MLSAHNTQTTRDYHNIYYYYYYIRPTHEIILLYRAHFVYRMFSTAPFEGGRVYEDNDLDLGSWR